MAKNRYLLIILFAVVFCTVNAQVPGYLGHRLLVSANVGPNIAFPFSVYSDDGYSPPQTAKFKFRVKFDGSLDYAYRRDQTIGIRYSFSKTNLSMPVFYKDFSQTYPFTTAYLAPAVVNCHTIDIRFTRYINGNLPAPLGKNWGINFGLGFAQFVDTKGAFTNSENKQEKGVYLTSICPNISPFFGIHRGLGKRMMYSVNAEFNLMALIYIGLNYDYDPYGSTFLGGYSTDDKVYSTHVGYFQNKVNRNAAGLAYYYSNIFNVSLGLSFLAF